MQRCIALFHNGLFNIVISEDLKKITEISKKHLTNGFLFCIFEKTESINDMNIIRKIDT